MVLEVARDHRLARGGSSQRRNCCLRGSFERARSSSSPQVPTAVFSAGGVG